MQKLSASFLICLCLAIANFFGGVQCEERDKKNKTFINLPGEIAPQNIKK
jgi:hypothetical protein